MTDFEFVVTGPKITKYGNRATAPVIEEIIRDAKSEIQMVAYLIGPSAVNMLKLLKASAERGITLTIIINDLEKQNKKIVTFLKKLQEKSPHCRVIDFKNLNTEQIHAKILIVDRKVALLGSANYSWGGMYDNYEIGVLLKGKPVWNLSNMVDSLSR
jgi:cardiolipin synthase